MHYYNSIMHYYIHISNTNLKKLVSVSYLILYKQLPSQLHLCLITSDKLNAIINQTENFSAVTYLNFTLQFAFEYFYAGNNTANFLQDRNKFIKLLHWKRWPHITSI